MFSLRAKLFWGLLTVAATIAVAMPPVIISEFMADNKDVLLDYAGNASDWIELQNTTDQPVDLTNWSLTDNIKKPDKWIIPAITLPPLGTIIIWASGDDLTDPTGELHTNFSLSKDGEYLGLYNATRTLAHDYAPTFPEQYKNTSYGTAFTHHNTEVVVLPTTTPVRVWCPPNNSLGFTWRDPTFNDATWSTGLSPVGYGRKTPTWLPELNMNLDAMAYGKPGVYLRIPFNLTECSRVTRLTMDMTYDDGAALFINGTYVYSANTALHTALSYNSFSTAVLNAPATANGINLTGALHTLSEGANTLAVHLMNCNATSSDLFFKAELRAVKTTLSIVPTPSYFNQPTPGAINGSEETLRIPQRVIFSQSGGIYSAPFSLMLSGAQAGQTIRYTTDGAIPTLTNNTLYTGTPITISASRHIRACLFDSIGRRSETTTHTFTFHATDPDTLNFHTPMPILIVRENDPIRNGIPAAESPLYTSCSAHLIEPHNGVARLTDAPALTSRIGLRVRGSSSASFKKKPYALTFWGEDDDDQKITIAGFPAGSDFALISCYNYDRTYLHDAFMFDLANQMGRYAPRTRFVEVFQINNETTNLAKSHYQGLYVLAERIRAGNDRLPVNSVVAAGDTNPPTLSGSYIFKADRVDADEFSWRTTKNFPSSDGRYMVLYRPKLDKVTEAQKSYIVTAFNNFEAAAYSATPMHPESGVGRFIDIPSFIDFHIAKAFSMDVDIFTLSSYFHKDRYNKIMAGPVWDFDRSLGPYGYDEAVRTNVKKWAAWTFSSDPFKRSDFWGKLHEQPAFQRLYWDRWFELRETVFSATNLTATAQRLKALIPDEAAERDYVAWKQRPSQAEGTTHTGQVNWMIDFVVNHAAWWDQCFTQKCSLIRAPTLTFAPAQEAQMLANLTFNAPNGNLIYFTLDGSDPTLWNNQPAPTAHVCPPGRSIQLTNSVHVFARAYDSSRGFWSVSVRKHCLIAGRAAQPGDILITEIHYHPPEPVNPPNPDWNESSFEFVELTSIAPCPINLWGCRFPQGKPASELIFGDLIIKPGERFVVARNREAFAWRYGDSVKPVACWLYSALSNSGEDILLLNRDGRALDKVAYKTSGQWPTSANGSGDSLHRLSLTPFTTSQWSAAPPSPGLSH